MATEYFPSGDVDFSVWGFNFATQVPAVVTAVGLPITVDDAFIAARTAYSTVLNAHIASQATALTATGAKDLGKETCIDLLRPLVKLLRAQPLFTNLHAATLGLPVYDDIQTSSAMTPTMSLETPALNVNSDARLRHVIDFRPVSGTSAAKPSWARACHIRFAIVAAGATAPSPTDMQYLASDTRTPYAWDIAAEHAGKDVWYSGAWENSGGERANWSDPAKATVRS